MKIVNSWENEDDLTHWIPYNYSPRNSNKRKSSKQSEAQRTNRIKFGLANSILTQIRPTLKRSFIRYDKGRSSGYNASVSFFLSNAIRGDYPNLEVNFSLMELSKGTLPGLSKWVFSIDGHDVLLEWTSDESKANANGDDRALLLIFNLSTQLFDFREYSALRKDEKISITFPLNEETDYVAWAFVINRSETNSSNSHYLGMFKI